MVTGEACGPEAKRSGWTDAGALWARMATKKHEKAQKRRTEFLAAKRRRRRKKGGNQKKVVRAPMGATQGRNAGRPFVLFVAILRLEPGGF
jgi:hypothetical protein